MYSAHDTPKGWVSPFGHPRINDRSHLPAAFRSVPRPSSPPGAKASTECPSFTPTPPPARRTQPHPKKAPPIPRDQSDADITKYANHSPQASNPAHARPNTRRLHTPDPDSPCQTTRTTPKGLSAQQAGFPDPNGTQAEQPQRRSTHQHQTKLSGDDRIRTDDPLLAKQVLSR